mmetsp:Transcript_83528/g.166794  ORF Transcript_83528/g.166794 Transcript_83528/m.166794 type:complete len:271 (+) Transcript_83528:5007-5819(+)
MKPDALKMVVMHKTEDAREARRACPNLRFFALDQNAPQHVYNGAVDLAQQFKEPVWRASSLVEVRRDVLDRMRNPRQIEEELLTKVFARSTLNHVLIMQTEKDILFYQKLCYQRKAKCPSIVGLDGFYLSPGGYIGGRDGTKKTRLEHLPRQYGTHPYLGFRAVETQDLQKKNQVVDIFQQMEGLERRFFEASAESTRLERQMDQRNQQAVQRFGEPLRNEPPHATAQRAGAAAQRASLRARTADVNDPLSQPAKRFRGPTSDGQHIHQL